MEGNKTMLKLLINTVALLSLLFIIGTLVVVLYEIRLLYM